ncbi:MAG: nucleoside-diphosphate-sugar pyrophosphorylase [Geobacter sp.]|nr:MAG: nucleoside-diphosphate-sugar pyrophosphorylase [Geobacter sp.]
MCYRVCIPVAGTGSRLGGLTRYLNKSLVTVSNRPVLSHIIEAFPKDCEFVIPLGYKGTLVQEFLQLAYPDRIFHYSMVNPYEGPRSGLGFSLLTCEKYLNEPFVFCSCDTLIDEQMPPLEDNWMGFAKVQNVAEYRTGRLCENKVMEVLDKGAVGDDLFAYIGLAGIKDHETFWKLMHQGGKDSIDMGESYALQYMAASSCVKGYEFNWHDCGNPAALEKTRMERYKPDEPNILEKANEAIWFVNKQVIKFSDDQKFIANRVKRVHELQGFVPEVTGARPHMYRYPKVEGKVLSEVVTLPLFEHLLEHCKDFWTQKTLNPDESQEFRATCMRFYRDKTFERVELFYKNFSRQDGTESINGVAMPMLDTLLNLIDWEWLADGLPGRFHGDFHFENILWTPATQHFTFLDWRQDFGGDLTTGDIYYDFAKLMHGLIICHELIARDFFTVEWCQDEITYDFHRKQILVECERYYLEWLDANQYDNKKVVVLTALIYLNIAALHHYPYSLLLYALGKSMLHQAMESMSESYRT